MFREESGAAALPGRDMPADVTLAAHASVCARAQGYQDSGAFPDGTRMDQYRVAAYLDLLNGTTQDARIASGIQARRSPLYPCLSHNAAPLRSSPRSAVPARITSSARAS
jgi:hypothetical protein